MAEIARLVLVAAMTALFAPAAAIIHESPYVSNGRGSFVIGQRLQSSNLFGSPRDYAAFWGVPYAQAPTGKLRFMPPQPVALPNGQLNASNASVPVCAQLLRGPAVEMGSEDCLTLQIFTPNYDPGANLSVLVFVHGGGFVYGRAPRDGVQFLMEHDVVVVAVDYRLGIFGWLSFEDEHVPGNQGLLDQVEALRWVQENIQLFGGNKDSVTLVGFSAGSASALLLTMSPMARGLFHRVVAVSGSPLNPWARQVSPRKNALKLAQMANCTTTSTMASVACLQSKSMSELIRVQRDFQDWLQHPFSPFAPVVDKYSKTPLLHDDPTNLVKSKTAVMDVPILMSITTHEGLFTAAEFMYKPEAMKKLNDEWEQWAPNLLHFHDGRVPDAEKPLMAKKIRDHYLPNGTLAEHRDALVMLMSDRNFVVGVSEYAVARAAAQNSPIYVYAFGYRGEFSLTSSESGLPDDMGVSHADDIQYIFEFLNWSGRMSRPSDLDIRRSMLTMWKTFANASVPILQGVNWQPQPRASEGSALHYLKIAAPTNMSMVQQKDAGQASFWTQLSIKESGNHSARATASVSLSLEMFFLAVLSVILF